MRFSTKLITGLLVFAFHAAGETIFVNNVTGEDTFDGRSEKAGKEGSGPYATIEKAFESASKSSRIVIANTGKPYQRPYPGNVGEALRLRVGGEPAAPLVVDGGNAVISGLCVIPATEWKQCSEDVYSIYFWPMSNMLKGYEKINHWPRGTQIWWLDGEAAKNCENMDELRGVESGGFWWNKNERELFFKLPKGKELSEVEVQIPGNMGVYINEPYTVVENLRVMFSCNDGFDIANNAENAVFRNCRAYDNCGQGFSAHANGNVTCEDCSAVRCVSSGACDVEVSDYERCLFVDNTFEAGIYVLDGKRHTFTDCLIARNRPFEQIWERKGSSLVFVNCVIVGNPKTNILSLRDGCVSFKNCTIVGGKGICSLSPKHKGRLIIKNCVMADCEDYFLEIQDGCGERVELADNVYVSSQGVGNIVERKRYGMTNWEEYLRIGIEKDSFLKDSRMTGFLGTIPKDVDLGAGTSVPGAKLPKEVRDRYHELLEEIPTPRGILTKSTKK